MQQLDLVDYINANPSAPPAVSAVAMVRDHLAQRGFWNFRSFRLAVDGALKLHGIPQIALAAEIDGPKDMVARAVSGRSVQAVFRLADALGYASTGSAELDAVFKLKRAA